MATTTTLLSWAFPQLIVTQSNNGVQQKIESQEKEMTARSYGFEMPLHYPRYTKQDYANMEEWRLDMLLQQYGLDRSVKGKTIDDKRKFAMGAFLWPHQL